MKIGIIGGSGLDNPDILENASEKEINTSYGKAYIIEGKIKGVDVVLLARHGKEHTITPTKVNYRANIQALKDLECSHVIATTAVGSLKEEIERGDLVILDQFIDFTRHRQITFHEEFKPGDVKHTSMAEPFDKELRKVLIDSCSELGIKFHGKGTVVTIEGPRLSTKAESKMFRVWGADVVNMSVAVEAILANEAGLPYAAVAMSTDYDCWKENEEPVTWKAILEVFKGNVDKVVNLLTTAIPKIKNGK